MIVLDKHNSAYGSIQTDDYGLLMDVWEHFTFYKPGYRYMKAFKERRWDGKIKLINISERLFPLGLATAIKKYFDGLKVKCTMTDELKDAFHDQISVEEMTEFFKRFKFYSKGSEIFPRVDQLYAVHRSLKYKRSVNICPTSFGKSLSIFMQALWHIAHGRKTIIVVPTVALVQQFENDIKDYCTVDGKTLDYYPNIHKIYGGQDKNFMPDTNIVISTWQSIYDIGSKFINKFDVIVLDECHKGQGECIQKVFNNATEVEYRTGWTGTLSDTTLNLLTAEGLMGPIEEIVDTKTLMESGVVADLNIVCTRIRYPVELSKKVLGLDYQNEIKFLEKYKPRTVLISKIAASMDQTGLMLYRHISHGELLRDTIRKMCPDRNVYFIHGGHFQRNDTMYKSIEILKPFMEADENGIVIANYQIFSTGLSIKNLRWLMFAAPSKSYVNVLQSIGRVLRVKEGKTKAVLIDIIDDLSVKKRVHTKMNYAMKHFQERFEIYTSKRFTYQMKTINLGE